MPTGSDKDRNYGRAEAALATLSLIYILEITFIRHIFSPVFPVLWGQDKKRDWDCLGAIVQVAAIGKVHYQK